MKKGVVLIICGLIIGMVFTAVSKAEVTLGTDEEAMLAETEITEGMSHEEFAKLLVKEVEVEGLLPAAASTNDIFKFWEENGVIPPGGWDAESMITREDLIAILGLSEEEAEDLTFDDLLKMLKKKLIALFEARQGIGPLPAVSPIAPGI